MHYGKTCRPRLESGVLFAYKLCDQVKLVIATSHTCCVHTCDISMSRNTENNIFGRRQRFEFLMFPTGLSKTKFQIGSHDPIF